MPVIFTIGRIALVLIFIVSGAGKLYDIQGTAAAIAKEVPIPALFSGLVTQLETATGMTAPVLMAIASGVIELGGGLMVALNFGTSFAALVLFLLTAASTYYFHDFWTMAGDARMQNMIHAEKNVAIMGGLLVFFVLGAFRPQPRTREEESYPQSVQREDPRAP